MRICAMILLFAVTLMAGCKGGGTEKTTKTDSPSADTVTPAAPQAKEGMAYREERDAAERDYAQGSKYWQGKSVELDKEEAVRWFRLAAEKGLPIAQYKLGNCYFDGEGVDQDYREAYFWGYIAVENGIDDLRGLRDAARDQLNALQRQEVQARADKWMALRVKS